MIINARNKCLSPRVTSQKVPLSIKNLHGFSGYWNHQPPNILSPWLLVSFKIWGGTKWFINIPILPEAFLTFESKSSVGPSYAAHGPYTPCTLHAMNWGHCATQPRHCATLRTLRNTPRSLRNKPRTLRNMPRILRPMLKTLCNTLRAFRNTSRLLRNTPRSLHKTPRTLHNATRTF